MAFQYKIKRQKELSGGFTVKKQSFELLRLISKHLQISRAELVAKALKSHLKAQNQDLEEKQIQGSGLKYLKHNQQRLRKKFRLRKSLILELRRHAKRQKKSQNFILHEALDAYFKELSAQDAFIFDCVKELEDD